VKNKTAGFDNDGEGSCVSELMGLEETTNLFCRTPVYEYDQTVPRLLPTTIEGTTLRSANIAGVVIRSPRGRARLLTLSTSALAFLEYALRM
jgi:hypothetical protein